MLRSVRVSTVLVHVLSMVGIVSGVGSFFDGGNIYTGGVPDFSGIRYGTGIGVRYYSNFGPIRVDVGTEGVVVVGAGGQVVDLGLEGGDGFGVTLASGEFFHAGFQAAEVVLADGVLFQVADAHAQGGEVGGEFLHGVLEGRQIFTLGSGSSASGHLVEQTGDDHGGFVTGQVLRAAEGAVRVAEDDATADQAVDGVLGPVTGRNVGQCGHLGRTGGGCRLGGGQAAEHQGSGENEHAFLHREPPNTPCDVKTFPTLKLTLGRVAGFPLPGVVRRTAPFFSHNPTAFSPGVEKSDHGDDTSMKIMWSTLT